MKNILVAIAIVLALRADGQKQEGQTCLFACMNHVDPRKSVDDYIRDFNQFTGSRQDVYSDGAAGTTKELAQFIKSEFDTEDLKKTTIMHAIDSGYSIISIVQPRHWSCMSAMHVIVLQGYHSSDLNDPFNTELVFYDPETGSNTERVTLAEFTAKWQVYALGVKRKVNGSVQGKP